MTGKAHRSIPAPDSRRGLPKRPAPGMFHPTRAAMIGPAMILDLYYVLHLLLVLIVALSLAVRMGRGEPLEAFGTDVIYGCVGVIGCFILLLVARPYLGA